MNAAYDARALRFLLLLIGGWMALRVVMSWEPAVPLPPIRPAPFAAAPVDAVAELAGIAVRRALPAAERPPRVPREGQERAGHGWAPGAAGGPPAAGFGGERHRLRLALMARLMPPIPAGAARSALPVVATWIPGTAQGAADAGRGAPFWMKRDLSGWSLSGWLYLREGSADAPGGIAAASQLGGSQAGARLAYGFGSSGRLRAYARATIATDRPHQRDIAFGFAYAPVPRWPVDVALERRVAVGREGRTALAAVVGGGVGDVVLPAGFRLEAYAQAGFVGARRRDGFADATLVADRQLGQDARATLRLGALAAGAVQPGVARVDVGPRLTLRLPDVGEGGRLALDWRQRVAGDALPESGLAVTLATDF